MSELRAKLHASAVRLQRVAKASYGVLAARVLSSPLSKERAKQIQAVLNGIYDVATGTTHAHAHASVKASTGRKTPVTTTTTTKKKRAVGAASRLRAEQNTPLQVRVRSSK